MHTIPFFCVFPKIQSSTNVEIHVQKNTQILVSIRQKCFSGVVHVNIQVKHNSQTSIFFNLLLATKHLKSLSHHQCNIYCTYSIPSNHIMLKRGLNVDV